MNREVYNRAFEYIKANPEEWDQRYWTIEGFRENNHDCGTACCIAGRVALQSGKPFSQSEPGLPSVRQLAGQELELSQWEEDWLFAESRTFPQLALVYRLGSVTEAAARLDGEEESES